MQYRYIKFRKFLFKNDAESALLLYDYFLERPRSGNIFIKKLLHLLEIIFRPVVVLIFSMRLGVIFPSKKLDSNFIISRKGLGFNATRIYLIKDQNGALSIIKQYPSEEDCLKETHFINHYKNSFQKVSLLPLRRINSTSVGMDFLRSKKLAEQICSGRISYNRLLDIYKTVCDALEELYQNENDERCLISGDLSPANVYITKDKLYFIDFSDSHFYEKRYDSFTFLKRLFYCYFGRDRLDLLLNYFSEEEIKRYNNHRSMIKTKKFSGVSRGKLQLFQYGK